MKKFEITKTMNVIRYFSSAFSEYYKRNKLRRKIADDNESFSKLYRRESKARLAQAPFISNWHNPPVGTFL